MSASKVPALHLMAAALVLSPLVTVNCGGLYTHQRRDYSTDPSVSDGIPERDPRGAWPLSDLPSSAVRFGDGTAARFLTDYLVVRPTSPEGLDALLENHGFLRRHARIEFEGDNGTILFPRADRWISSDGVIQEQEVDVLLEIDWPSFAPDSLQGVGADVSGEGATYDSEKAASVVRIARYLKAYDSQKIISASPVTLAVLGVNGVEISTGLETEELCPCVRSSDGQHIYNSIGGLAQNSSNLVYCGAETHTQGTNLLTVQSASVSAQWDSDGHVQRPRLWFMPDRDDPLHIPGLGALDIPADAVGSLSNFESWLPPLSHSTQLQGTAIDDSAACGWSATNHLSNVRYEHAGHWYWIDPAQDESIQIFAYEHDPGTCIHGLFCAGLDDDLLGIVRVAEEQTYGQIESFSVGGLHVSLATVPECYDDACSLNAEDCADPDGELQASLLGFSCVPPQYDAVCHEGTYVCINNQVVCDGAVPILPEICDGQDDDCSGTPDDPEWENTECMQPGEIIVNLAPEETGLPYYMISRCVPGAWQCDASGATCVAPSMKVSPIDEACNGEVPHPTIPGEVALVDDDCDGVVDEGCDCPGGSRECGISEGACETGTQVCITSEATSRWSDCCSYGCSDGGACEWQNMGMCVDQYCCSDGVVCPEPPTMYCPTGGECGEDYRCVDDAPCLTFLYDDCCYGCGDGGACILNNGGQCPGQSCCSDGVVCRPQTMRCRAGGECAVVDGQYLCEDGTPCVMCDYQIPRPEDCVQGVDGFAIQSSEMDENCNGLIDEDLTNACGHCSDAVPSEVCNYIDDDCDIPMEIDEGLMEGNICRSCYSEPEMLAAANLPYGLHIEQSAFFSANNAGVSDVQFPAPPVPPGGSIYFVVFVEEYVTSADDDYNFQINMCGMRPMGLVGCEVQSWNGNGGSHVSGRIFAITSDQAGTLDEVSWTQLGSGCTTFGLGAPVDDLLTIGITEYQVGDEDDYSFTAESVPTDAGDRDLRVCGGNTNGGAAVVGRATSFSSICSAAVFPVDVEVFEGSPQDINWVSPAAMWDPQSVIPILGVSAYQTNTDDDVNWLVTCGPAPDGVTYTCHAEVTGGGASASHIRLTGFFLHQPG